MPMYLLAIETSSESCSAALSCAGELLTRAEHAPRQHARMILPMIDAVLAEAGISMSQVDAFAYGHGPGAFTGVRIGAGLAMGLADGSAKPLFGVSCLQALALQAQRRSEIQTAVLACTDARMGEVYWGWFAEGADQPGREEVCQPQLLMQESLTPLALIGDGAARYADLQPLLQAAQWQDLTAMPLAEDIARLAQQRWQVGERPQPVNQQPVYLRDRVADPSARVHSGT